MNKNNQNIKYILILLLATLVLYSPMINKFYIGHDTTFHLTNMNMFLDKLQTFTFFSYKIFGTGVAGNLGYGTFIFYPSFSYLLTAYIGNILYILKTPEEMSITLSLSIIAFLSSLSIFYSANKLYKDKMISTLGGITYISSIYFLCNTYVRGALAESLTFIFIPIVFSALYELFNGNTKKFYLLFVIGYTGMINSHLVISVYLTTLIIIIFIINYKKVFKLKYIKPLLISSLIVLLISSPYLVPLVEHKIKGNYVVFDKESMYSIYELKYHVSHLYDYLYMGNKTENGIRVYINYITLICLIIVIYNKKSIIKTKEKEIYRNLLIFLLASIFLTSSLFPWEIIPKFFYNIQFPWRIFTFVSFAISLLSCLVIRIIPNKGEKIIVPIIIILTLLLSLNSLDNIKDYSEEVPYYFNNDLGHQVEYLPVNTRDNYEYFESRSNTIEIIEGNAKIKEILNDTPYLEANIDLEGEKVTLELPRLYYLGYRIKLIDKNNNKINLNYYENEKGFMEVTIPKSGTMIVKYKGTKLGNISFIISIIVILLFPLIINNCHKEKTR